MRAFTSSVALAAVLGGAAISAAPVPVTVPGARGVCITEMDGGERVEIPVTVLGTLAPAAPEGELVLVRLEDPRFERTGIIAGMSGSPVYVEGRLLGALAYGWPFSREPIGGVTPWARMEVLGGPEVPGGGGGRPELAELAAGWNGPEPGRALLEWLVPEAPAGLAPLPLAVTWSAAPARGWLGEARRRMGWVDGGAVASVPVPERSGPLRPGDMVATVLLSGDATVAAGGTVTEVRGGRVWAFGHPFLGGGGLELPLARAHVISVLPSLMSSFKFFAVGEPVGALEQDRARGIVGRLGARAATVPLEVRAAGRTYRFRAPVHPVLLPLLAAYVTDAAHGARGRTFGELTLRCRLEVRYRDGRTAAMGATFPATDAPARAAAMVGSVVGYLMATPYRAPEVTGIAVELEAVEGIRTAELAGAWPDRQRVRPGERLGVTVRLVRRGAATATRRVELEVPQWVRGGRIDLIVADGAAWTEYDLKERPVRPARFEDELRLLGRFVPADTLVVVLEEAVEGAAVPGGIVAAPPSQLLVWRRTLGSAAGRVRRLVAARADLPVPWPLRGAVRIPLEVLRDGQARGHRKGER